MYRRRLMQRTGDRHEIVNRKCPRVILAIPADDIEGMIGHRVARQERAVLDQDRRVLIAVDGKERWWTVQSQLAFQVGASGWCSTTP